LIELPDYSRLVSKVAPGDWEQLQRIIDAIRELQDGDIIDPPDPIPTTIVRPEDYDLGSDQLNITAAITEGMASRRPVRLDGSYTVSAPFPTFAFSGSEKLTVTGNGDITVVANSTTPTFLFHAVYPESRAVLSIVETTRMFPGAELETTCTRINVALHDYVIGDLLKIVSDDQLVPQGGPDRRQGEFVYVADVDGDDIYVAGYLRDTYTLTPRTVKVRTAARFVWDGPTIGATPNQITWGLTFLMVRGFAFARVKTGFRSGYSQGLYLSSCFMTDCEVHGIKMLNHTSGNSNGYFLRDDCSAYTVARIKCVDARHAYTTGTTTSILNDEAYRYGRTYGSNVSGVAHGCASAAFDIHSEATDITFQGVSTGGGRSAESANGIGVQLRGHRTKLLGGTDFQSVYGAGIHAQTAGDCVDNEINDFCYSGSGEGIRFNFPSAVNPAVRPRSRGGVISTTFSRSIAVYLCQGAVIEGLHVAPVGSTEFSEAVYVGGNTDVLIKNITVDLTNFTGTNYRIVGIHDNGSNVVVDGVRVFGAAGKLQSFVTGGNNTGTLRIGGLSSDAPPIDGNVINGDSLAIQRSDAWWTIGTWNWSTDVPSVDFTDITTDEVRVIARGVTKSVAGTLNFRTSITNGATFMAVNGNYTSIAADGQETSLTYIAMHDTDTTAARGGTLTLSGLRGKVNKLVTSHNRNVTHVISTLSRISAVQVLPTSGNLTGGTITVLGR